MNRQKAKKWIQFEWIALLIAVFLLVPAVSMADSLSDIRSGSADQSLSANLLNSRQTIALNTTHSGHRVTAGLQQPTPAPIPSAVWLLGTGLVGLLGIKRRIKKQ